MPCHKEHISDRVAWLEGFTESLADRLEFRTEEARKYRRVAWAIALLNAITLLGLGVLI